MLDYLLKKNELFTLRNYEHTIILRFDSQRANILIIIHILIHVTYSIPFANGIFTQYIVYIKYE